ncbi:hypothetical protein [Vreelandella sp. GE22]
MYKLVLMPALIALLLGGALSFASEYFERSTVLEKYGRSIEEEAAKRREAICEKIADVFPENSAASRSLALEELKEIEERKRIRAH